MAETRSLTIVQLNDIHAYFDLYQVLPFPAETSGTCR